MPVLPLLAVLLPVRPVGPPEDMIGVAAQTVVQPPSTTSSVLVTKEAG